MTEHHPEFKSFQLVSSLDVDAGSIWIGDGCYVLKDKDDARPKDLGDDWHGICSRFFERSGYNAHSREWQSWAFERSRYLFDHADWKAWMEENPREHGKTEAHHVPGTPEYQAKHELMNRVYEEFSKENPFTPAAVDKGFANFTHDGGHGGMGTMISTYYGDGSYPVYIEYGEGGRPRRVLIDFDPGADEEEEGDEILEAAE